MREAADTEELLDGEFELLQEQLDVSVTSTTLTAHTTSAAPAMVVVISLAQIQNLGFRTLSEALQMVPGMTVLDQQDNRQTVISRGIANEANILVLLDGQTLNDFYDGSFPHDFPLDSIDRIEIIRGPGSALYGTNAFAAVISLFSKTAELPGSTVAAGLRGTALIDHEVGAAGAVIGTYAFRGDKWSVRTFLSYEDSSGPRVRVKRDATEGRSYSEVPGNTEAFAQTGSAQAFAQKDGLLTDGDSLQAASYFRFNRKGPYFGLAKVFAPQSVFTRMLSTSYLQYRIPIGTNIQLNTRLSADVQDVDKKIFDQPRGYVAYGPSSESYEFAFGKVREIGHTANRLNLSSYATLDWPNPSFFKGHNLIVGLAYEYDWLGSFSYAQNFRDDLPAGGFGNHDDLPLDQRNKNRGVLALLAQYQMQVTEDLAVVAGMRFDHYSDFGPTWNPRIAVTWALTPQLSMKLLYGQAFRAPTFAELYDKTSRGTSYERILGNDDLDPETTRTLEAGLEWSPFKISRFSLNGFYVETDDVIDINMDFAVSGQTYLNYPGLRILGTELEMRLMLFGQSYFLTNFSWFLAKQLGKGVGDYAANPELLFMDTDITSFPSIRANAAFVARLTERLELSARYAFVSSCESNRRFDYEILRRAFHRDAFHETSLYGRWAILDKLLEASLLLSKSFQERIPITLGEHNIYQLPANQFRIVLGVESQF